MPGDCLSLRTGIACQIDLVGMLRVLLERLDEIALAAYVDVLRREVPLSMSTAELARQIPARR